MCTQKSNLVSLIVFLLRPQDHYRHPVFNFPAAGGKINDSSGRRARHGDGRSSRGHRAGLVWCGTVTLEGEEMPERVPSFPPPGERTGLSLA